MKHVMLDLETMGTVPGCVVLAIGAVYFDETGLGDEFYSVISRRDSQECGLHESEPTRQWWSKQSEDARKVVLASEAPEASPVRSVLLDFGLFLKKAPGVKVWGNGADFDNPILACAYEAVELRQAWVAWNGRCYRTLKNIAGGPSIVRVGTHHNALDDAKSQALHAIEIFKLNPTLVLK